jgi:uncharacterized DUF497 family protein
MEFDGFDWDHGNRDKCRKHGVSIGEIESLLTAHYSSGRTRRIQLASSDFEP